jgi:hypothetical protein
MIEPWLWIVLSVMALAALLALLLSGRRGVPFGTARELFRRQREHLEAAFFRAASASGKPRGLRWTHCDWDDGAVAFARDRKSGQYLALVGEHEDGRWATAGRTVFNLNPDEAITHFGNQYERVEAP